MYRPPKRLLLSRLLRLSNKKGRSLRVERPFLSEASVLRPPALLQGGKSTHKQFDNGADPKNHFTIRI